jgi:hypothetical protein
MIIAKFKQVQEVIAMTINLYELTFAEVSREAKAKGFKVSPATVSKMYHGKTKSPHWRTVMGVLSAIGYKVHITSRTKVAQMVFTKVPWG